MSLPLDLGVFHGFAPVFRGLCGSRFGDQSSDHFNVKISAPYVNDLDVVSVNQYSSNSHFIYFNGTLPIKQPRGLLIQG